MASSRYSREIDKLDKQPEKDIKKSTEFYTGLGLQHVGGKQEEGWVILSYVNLRLALFQGDIPAWTINFRGGDVDKIYNILKERNFHFEKEANLEEDGSKGATIRDPDGNLIYFNTASSEINLF